MGLADPRSGMYTITAPPEVIDVTNRIKCGFHLIPKYRNTLHPSPIEVPSRCFGLEVFQHFKDLFFLNSWIEIYQYDNNIY